MSRSTLPTDPTAPTFTTAPTLGIRATFTTRTARTLLVAATTAALLAGPLAPARADPSLADVQRQAAELRLRLDQLGVRQGLAVEQYDTAAQALQQATTAEVVAAADLTDARRAMTASADVGTRRVRALYMSGGPLGLTATVLDSADLGDAVTRWQAVERIVRADVSVSADHRAEVAAARTTAGGVERSRALTSARRLAADQAVAGVHAALAAQAALLAAADAEVIAVADQQRREAEATALAQAAVTAARLGIPTDFAMIGSDTTGRSGAAAARAIAAARTRLGLPYVWGATGPDSFDCSGLTGWAYRQAGIAIPRTSRQQYAALPRVPLTELEPGDLVFYATDVTDPGTIHHVSMYVGAGRSLYAPQTGSVVKIGPVGYGQIIGAVRPAPAA